MLIDAGEPISEQDIRVIQQVIDAGRALLASLAYNRGAWCEERRHYLEREIEKEARPDPVGLARQCVGTHRPAPGELVPALEVALDS